ncbi:hypothetical protein ACHMW6_29120 [Pseudoduganella sp. UC29_106]|uniref:hypothetical protein n=1 Tax=Pseudoduganella sp. UC29_106 TaxID=3374553 RepID=UPI0037580744
MTRPTPRGRSPVAERAAVGESSIRRDAPPGRAGKSSMRHRGRMGDLCFIGDA